MGVKSEYKRTEVGVIPEDWEITSVKRLVEDCVIGKPLDGNHGNIHPKSSDYVEDGIPFVMANNVVDGQVNLRNCKFIKREQADKLRKGFSIPGDVLLTHKGTVGNTAIVGALCTDYIMLTPQVTYYRVTDANRLDNVFLRQYFDTRSFQSLFENLAGGGTRAYLGIVKQLELPVVRPPVEEQRAIATALSDVDALTGSLEELIAKKRDLKMACMQQLLNGRTRLSGFKGEWETKRLGDVVDTDPENLGSQTQRDFAFNYISLDDVDRGRLRNNSQQVFAAAPSRARRKLRTNDVLVSTVRPNLQSHLLFRENVGDWICSTGFCVIRCREGLTYSGYVITHFFASPVNRQIDALLTGSSYPAINSGDVRALEIPLPSYKEQVAIADMLKAMDAEIEALEERLNKTRNLKLAMMQELLTGQIRLVTPEAQHA